MREKVGLFGMMMMMMMMMIMEGSVAVRHLHYIGGTKFGWFSGANLSRWSASRRFYVHDWLFFGFDKNQNNVLEVNKMSYDQCITTDFVYNITRGGRDVFELKKAQKYYFIDGKGFCFGGLKLMVNVQQKPPPPPPVSPPQLSASGGNGAATHPAIIMLLIICCLG